MIKIKKTETQKPQDSVPEPETNYHKQYYLKRKEEIALKKRERYLNDPEYQKSIKERAVARWFEKLKKDPCSKIKELSEIPFDKRHMRVVYRNGDKIRFYSAKALANIIGVSTETIKNWHEMGILPMPLYIANNAKKFYSEVYVENIRNVLMERRYSDLQMLKELVARRFDEINDVDFTGKTEISDEDKEEINKLFDEDRRNDEK